MLKIVIVILSVIILIGGFWLVKPDQKNVVTEAQVSTQSNSNFRVIYTNEGFDQNELEIPMDSQVSFVNNSDIPMWPASDPHPTHTDYPEFDAKKDYLKGETFTFTFTKAGTFRFHNHENSLHRAIIRVTDSSHVMPNIDKTLPHQIETRNKLLSMLKKNDTGSIYTVIDTIEKDNTIANDCHDMAHDLGHKAYEMYGFSGAMTFNDSNRLSHASADDICAGGYMHGILEELFLHQPELKENPGPICSGIPDDNRDSCFHGVGHGLMFVNKRNIPKSLATCQTLNNFTDEHRCYEGVWMEMFWGDTSHAGADSLGWDLSQPLKKCAQAELTQKPTCFLYAHLGYLRTHHRDFVGALNWCTQSGLFEPDVRFCVKGIGITMMKHVTSQHLNQSESLVANLDYERKYAYYEGVIGYAKLSNVKESVLVDFCNSLKTDFEVCSTVLKDRPRDL